MNKKTFNKVMASALILLGCSALSAQVARPATLWFGKATTPERSRQVFVGLNANMWVLYDLPQAVLYQAWKGGTTGGTLTTASKTVTPEYWFGGTPHFPHIYVTSGTNYFHDSVSEYFASYTVPAQITLYYTKWPHQPLNYQGWVVNNAGNVNVGAVVRYRGYSVPGNVFTFNFSLILPDSSAINVTESPEYATTPLANNLVRTFNFSGIPAGYQVELMHLGGTNAAAWSVTSGSATLQGGVMVQTANGQTVLTGSWN